jgi:hypothetical protein
VARGRSSTCSLTTAVRLLGDRIAAPLGERREAFQVARKNRNLVCAIIRLRTSLRAATLGSQGQVLVRTVDELAAVRDGVPFPAARGKFTVAIFLGEQPPARQHLARVGSPAPRRACRLSRQDRTTFARSELYWFLMLWTAPTLRHQVP